MVALLPITTDWSKLALPHMTVVYAGEVTDHYPTDFNVLAKTVASVAMEFHPIQLQVMGLDIFGPEEDRVEVIRLRPTPTLLAIHRRVMSWDQSNFPFNPHVTIGPIGSFSGELPPALAFDRIMVGWGEQQLNFWLRP